MIFQFHTQGINYFDEDREYFEQKLSLLQKYFSHTHADEDTIVVHINLEKTHHKNSIYIGKINIKGPNHGNFFIETEEESIRAIADVSESKLARMIKEFYTKKTKK